MNAAGSGNTNVILTIASDVTMTQVIRSFYFHYIVHIKKVNGFCSQYLVIVIRVAFTTKVKKGSSSISKIFMLMMLSNCRRYHCNCSQKDKNVFLFHSQFDFYFNFFLILFKA